jgi:hypothetical protein
MKLTAAVIGVAVALATAGCLSTGNDHAGRSTAEQKAVNRATGVAEDLLEKAPPSGYSAEPVASGHNGSGDAGQEVAGTVKGRGLLQVACAGTGEITVTIPAQDVSETVHCGAKPRGFPFRKSITALLVGRVDSTGAYAWRILPAS